MACSYRRKQYFDIFLCSGTAGTSVKVSCTTCATTSFLGARGGGETIIHTQVGKKEKGPGKLVLSRQHPEGERDDENWRQSFSSPISFSVASDREEADS